MRSLSIALLLAATAVTPAAAAPDRGEIFSDNAVANAEIVLAQRGDRRGGDADRRREGRNRHDTRGHEEHRGDRDLRRDNRRDDWRDDRRDHSSQHREYRRDHRDLHRSDPSRREHRESHYDLNRDHRADHRDWRTDRRYDWRRYRDSNRGYYQRGRYNAPYRGHRYSRFNVGIYLGSGWFGQNYWINDPWQYRLPAAYGGYRWIRYYDDVLLVDTRTGYVADVIYDFFY